MSGDHESELLSRRTFVVVAAAATASVFTGGVTRALAQGGGPAVPQAPAAPGAPPNLPDLLLAPKDLLWLGMAHRLEALEVEFLSQVVRSHTFTARLPLAPGTLGSAVDFHAIFRSMLEEDRKHLDAVEELYRDGRKQVPARPNFKFSLPQYTFSPPGILITAREIKEAAIGLYMAALGTLETHVLARWFGRISGVDSEHLVLIQLARGVMPPNTRDLAPAGVDAANRVLTKYRA